MPKYIGCYSGELTPSGNDKCLPPANMTIDTCDKHCYASTHFMFYISSNFNQSVVDSCCTCSSTREPLLYSAKLVNDSYCGTDCNTNICKKTPYIYPLYSVVSSNITGGIPISFVTANESHPVQHDDPYLARVQIRIAVLVSLVALVCMGFIYSTYFSLVVEVVQSGNKVTYKQLATPFNVQLFIIGLSLIGMLSDFLHSLVFPDTDYTHSSMGQYICLCLFETLYIKYSWARSRSVVDIVLPRSGKMFGRCVRISPVILVPQVVPPILLYLKINSEQVSLSFRVLPIIAAACTVLFDLCLLGAFTVYIQTYTRVEKSEQISPRFLIISHYGAVSCICGVLSVVVLGISRVMDYEMLGNMAIVAYGLIAFAYFALVGMKVALHFWNKKEMAEKSLVQRKAKLIATASETDLRPVSAMIDMTQ
ncbi:hypothetical protein BDR26DRAFT_867677 [Obelidium mucronatum]|nr:hypothetical protein BDR26DRAFT_867677 [Obelidium mucronatum]